MRIVTALMALAASVAPVQAQEVMHTFQWLEFDGLLQRGQSWLLDRQRWVDTRQPPHHGRQSAQTRPRQPSDPPDGVGAAGRDDAGTAIFADGTTMTLFGHGHGQTTEIDLDAAMLPGWIHLLTASPPMQLVFDGNEPSWQVDLSGTTKVVNAMGDCIKNHGITGVPAPFTPSSFAQSGSSPLMGSSTPAPGGDASFALALSQMGPPRADVAPSMQYAPAPSPVAPPPAPPPPVAASQRTLDCAGIVPAQDRLACSLLSVGAHIRFTAHPLSGSTDCFEETSLTQSGSMTSRTSWPGLSPWQRNSGSVSAR